MDQQPDRVLELLAEEASGEIDAADLAEIERVFGEMADIDRDELMRVAGLVQIGFLMREGPGPVPMPEHLRNRIAHQAEAFLAARREARGDHPGFHPAD